MTPNRPRQLHFWVTEEELDGFRSMAKTFGLSVTQYVRYVLHLEVERHRTAIKGRSAKEIAAIGMLMRARVGERDKAIEQHEQAKRPRRRPLI